MEKTLTIDGKQVKFKSTAATPLRYKAQFGKDFFSEIIKLNKLTKLKFKDDSGEPNYEAFELIDFEVFYNIIWALAKSGDPTISDPITWLDDFEEFPMFEVLPELQDLMAHSIKGKKKIKNGEASQGDPITTDSLLLLCRQCGLNKDDLDDMTIGMCLDYIEEYIEMQNPKKKKARRATQNDFDSF